MVGLPSRSSRGCVSTFCSSGSTKGAIVDATIINAPSSTKNASQSRDADMHQTKKGKQWYFGMKAHIGVDSKTKVIHSVVPLQPT